MKKNILFATFTLLMMTSCSKTWSGIKQDTSEIVGNTKEVIHEATAPDAIIEDVPQSRALPSSSPVQPVRTNVQSKPIAVEPTI